MTPLQKNRELRTVSIFAKLHHLFENPQNAVSWIGNQAQSLQVWMQVQWGFLVSSGTHTLGLISQCILNEQLWILILFFLAFRVLRGWILMILGFVPLNMFAQGCQCTAQRTAMPVHSHSTSLYKEEESYLSQVNETQNQPPPVEQDLLHSCSDKTGNLSTPGLWLICKENIFT